jgi:multiple sugar transport system substrate-binding protein
MQQACISCRPLSAPAGLFAGLVPLRRRALLAQIMPAAAGTATLAACVRSPGRPVPGGTAAPREVAAPREPATIQFWPTWAGQWQVEGMSRVIEAFQAQHPQLTVELTPFGGQFDKILTAIAGGTPPDVVTLSGSTVIQFGRRGAVQPLNERLARSAVVRMELFYPAQWEAASWEGKIYGIPAWEHGPSPFLFWNTQHFAERGLAPEQPPATLAEAAAYAERLTVLSPDGQITRLGWEPLTEAGDSLLGYWANAYEVSWYDPQARRVNLVQPGLLAALEYLTMVYQRLRLTPERIQDFRRQYPRWNAPQAGMAQGAESMKVSSYVSAGTLARNAPQQPIAIGWAPAHRPRTFVTLGGGWRVSLVSGAAQPEASFRFMEWLTTPEANQRILDEIGWIGYNKAVATGLRIDRVPNLRFVLDAPRLAQQVLAPVILPVETEAVNAGVQRVLAGQQGAREMLQEATHQLQTALDEALRVR